MVRHPPIQSDYVTTIISCLCCLISGFSYNGLDCLWSFTVFDLCDNWCFNDFSDVLSFSFLPILLTSGLCAASGPPCPLLPLPSNSRYKLSSLDVPDMVSYPLPQSSSYSYSGHIPSSVAMVSGLHPSKMNCTRIFNLFCLYGNIEKVIICVCVFSVIWGVRVVGSSVRWLCCVGRWSLWRAFQGQHWWRWVTSTLWTELSHTSTASRSSARDSTFGRTHTHTQNAPKGTTTSWSRKRF